MAYIDGFLTPVPTANKERYIELATVSADVFKEHGALQLVECWGDEVSEGKLTSMPQAVNLEDTETVVFSWIVWPSRETRDAAMARIMADPRLQAFESAIPFDGKRMIFGSFIPVVGDAWSEHPEALKPADLAN